MPALHNSKTKPQEKPLLMTQGVIDSTANATPPKSTKSRYPNSSVQTQIPLKSQFEFVLRDTEEYEWLDLVDFGVVAFSVENVISRSLQEIIRETSIYDMRHIYSKDLHVHVVKLKNETTRETSCHT